VTGPARSPRRGERHRALVRVNLVNGEPPVEAPAAKKDKDPGSGRSGSAAKTAGSARSVEVSLVSVDDDGCVIEIEGAEHRLEPGEPLTVELD
jgi:hypothetical protein